MTPLPPHASEHALTLEDITIGMKVTVHSTADNTRVDYTVADIPRQGMVGNEGRTADILLRDDSGKERKFSAADIGLLQYLGGYWNTSTYTTHWEASLNTPILGDVPRP
jgi:hypothetical protein